MNALRVIIIGFYFMFFGIAMVAQLPNPARGDRLRERFVEVKFKEIGKMMMLSDAQKEELRPIYIRFEKDKFKMKENRGKAFIEANVDNMTDAQAEEMFKDELGKMRDNLMIREKYYEEFKKVLSPRQIVKFFQCEVDIQKRMFQEFKRRQEQRREKERE